MKTQAQPTVLLVEDDAITGIIYKEFLSGEDVKVIHAETGAEALAYIQQAVPDMVFLDLGLPDMNGMEILKHIHQHKLNSIVIVITAQNSVDIVIEAMRLGAFDFLVKTILPERFKLDFGQISTDQSIKFLHARERARERERVRTKTCSGEA
ncbi:MAG: response regulator, partial [Gammaproteobacteria bacterium]|nr:response regulator [Gammaproteobacteria bacterium]